MTIIFIGHMRRNTFKSLSFIREKMVAVIMHF